MQDQFGRTIEYLRLSVTDRCNLRCRYCMPEEGVAGLSHGDVLRYEEMLRVVAAACRLGIRKVRVTGGEPLVRRGIVSFIGQLANLPGNPEIQRQHDRRCGHGWDGSESADSLGVEQQRL